jgi:TonB family protein
VAQIQFIVSSRGTVHNVSILQGTGNAVLDNAAVDALKKTKFIPAVLNGESVSSRMKLDIEFKGHQTIKSSGFGTIHTTVDKDPIPKKEIMPLVNIDHDAAVVQIQFIVTSRGRVHNVEIIQGTGDAVLDNAAVDALKKTKFIPAVLNGESVSSRTKMDVAFKGTKRKKKKRF